LSTTPPATGWCRSRAGNVCVNRRNNFGHKWFQLLALCKTDRAPLTSQLPVVVLGGSGCEGRPLTLDEAGYVLPADIGAEFLFQAISDRAERAALIVTTNLPSSDWSMVFPHAKSSGALVDRITVARVLQTSSTRVKPVPAPPHQYALREATAPLPARPPGGTAPAGWHTRVPNRKIVALAELFIVCQSVSREHESTAGHSGSTGNRTH